MDSTGLVQKDGPASQIDGLVQKRCKPIAKALTHRNDIEPL